MSGLVNRQEAQAAAEHAGLAGMAVLRTGLQPNEGRPNVLTKTNEPRPHFTQPNLPSQYPSQAMLQPSILLAGDTLCLISYLLGFLSPFVTPQRSLDSYLQPKDGPLGHWSKSFLKEDLFLLSKLCQSSITS